MRFRSPAARHFLPARGTGNAHHSRQRYMLKAGVVCLADMLLQ
jgi:hypothetical protein